MINQNPKNLKIAFFSNHTLDAMAVMRVLGPASKCGIEVIPGYQDGKLFLDEIVDCNLFIHQRDFCKHLNANAAMVTLAHSKGIPVVFDLDDLLFELPEDHPDRQSGYFVDALIPMLQAVLEADVLTVSNENLARYLSPFNENITVLPNFLNDDLWKINSPLLRDHDDTGKITIGYMGGPSHKPDLEMVLPVMIRLAEKYPTQIEFKFYGIQAPPEIESVSETLWIHPGSYIYSDFSTFFQTQKLDLAFAPLRDIDFNKYKSFIKYLEYSAIGAPAVFSRTSPYIDVIIAGQTGLFAESQDEWYSSLVTLIENPILRQQIATNAQKDVIQKWLLSNNLSLYSNIYLATVENPVKTTNLLNPMGKLIHSLNFQLNEFHELPNKKIETLQQKLLKSEEIINVQGMELKKQEQNFSELNSKKNESDQLNQQLQSVLDESLQKYDVCKEDLILTEEELVLIHASRSWQLTRPIRKLMGRLRRGTG